MQVPVNAVENDADKIRQEQAAARDTAAHVPQDAAEPDNRPTGGRFVYATGDRPLDGFTLKRGIGHGGFGEVYQAVNDAGKEVAVKLVRRNLEIELRGIRQCLNLKHPNLVAVYDIRRDLKGDSWVVMDHVAGPSLEEEIRAHPNGLPVDEALGWFLGIAAAVAYLHDHGVVHRDLKPGNVFRDEGVVKVGDYGLSKFISASRRSGHTESIGTVHYMAPEVANGRYGQEIDIYALGIILYEMLTGTVPFEGESIGEVLMKHLTARPDLSRLVEPYRSVVARSLEKDPKRRYASVAQMVAALPRPPLHGGFAPYYGPLPETAEGASSSGTKPDPPAAGAAGGPAPAGGYAHRGGLGGHPGQRHGAPHRPYYRPHAGVRREPLLRGLCRAWGALTTPLQVIVVLLFIFVIGPLGGFPLLILGGMAYFVYYIVWLLVTEASEGYREANAELERAAYERRFRPAGGSPPPSPRPRVAMRPGSPFQAHVLPRPVPAREAPPIRKVKKPTADELAAAALRKKPFGRRVVELLGAMLLAAATCALLCLGVLITESLVEQREVFRMQDYAGYAWLFIVSTIGSWCVLWPAKFWEGVRGEGVLRWMTMIVFGLGLGLMAAAVSMALLADLPHNYGFPQLGVGALAGREPATLFPAPSWADLAYYLAGFGAVFATVRWWYLADPLRRGRLQFFVLLFIGLKAVVLADLIGWPQPWLPLAVVMMAAATQIAAPWIPPSERASVTFE